MGCPLHLAHLWKDLVCSGLCRTHGEAAQCPPCLGFRWARGQMRGWGALSWPPSTTCGPGLGMSRGLLGAKHSGPTTTEGPGFLGTDKGLQMAAGRQQAGGDLPGPLQWVLWGAHGRAPRGSLVRLPLHQACLSGRRTAFVSSGSVLCPLQQAPAYPVCQGLLSGVSHSQSLCSYRFPPSPSSGKNTPVTE